MPTHQEFADRWGITNVRVQQLEKAGMPMGDWSAAEAWRMQQKGGLKHLTNKLVEDATSSTGSSSPLVTKTGDALNDMDDFSTELETQRQIVKLARGNYLKALKEGSKDANKHYITLNKAIDQLFKTRDKQLAHRLATRQLISAPTALESFRKVLAIVVQRMEANEIKTAKDANPSDKARALKVIREARLKIMREVYEKAEGAAYALTGLPIDLPPLDDGLNPSADPLEAFEDDDASPDTPEESNPV